MKTKKHSSVYIRSRNVKIMSYPNNPDKYASEGIITPKKFAEYSRTEGNGSLNFNCPSRVILTFSKKLLKHVQETYNHRLQQFSGTLLLLEDHDVAVVGGFGIGGPITSVIVEELGAIGAKEFIIVGTAGAIAKDIDISDMVIVDRAIRDEGVSHHYLPPGKYAYASESLLKGYRNLFEQEGLVFTVGTSWTIDAPYRETVAEVKQYQKEGVLAVEMEAATVYTIAKFRGFHAIALLAISDDLSDYEWNPQFHAGEVADKLSMIIDFVIKNE